MMSRVGPLVKNLIGFQEKEFIPESVLSCLKAARLSDQCVERYAHFEKDFYTRNLVCKTPQFEMLLLCWEPGQTTLIHDHASQGCWMTVVQGIITSDNYKYVSATDFTGSLERLPSQSFKAGESYYIDDQVSLHLLKNPVKAQMRTTTLHVYAKPFGSCRVYDLEKKSTEELALKYHSIGGKRGSWLAREISNTH